MRRLLLCLFALIVIAACKKGDTSSNAFQGIWIEKTQRLDTIHFDNLAFSGSNPATLDFRSRPSTYSSFYNYDVKTDSILLRNFVSSSLMFNAYNFKQNGSSLLTIGNFYHKPSLPAILQFERMR
jgi:hypothetical protein